MNSEAKHWFVYTQKIRAYCLDILRVLQTKRQKIDTYKIRDSFLEEILMKFQSIQRTDDVDLLPG